MTDVIVLILVVLVLLVALRGTIKHFKGEGACCGGGNKGLVKTEKKTLKGPVKGKMILHIAGMNCEHCRQTVEASLNRIQGAAAQVDLKKNQAVVEYDRDISDEMLKKAVNTAGFSLTSISRQP